MTLSEIQKAEVQATMKDYANAYKNKNIEELMAIFSTDISGFGSGLDEIILNYQDFTRQIERDMSQAEVKSVEFTDTKIFGEGNIAWVTAKSSIIFSTDGKNEKKIDGRSTMVMRNNKKRYIIEQIHYSMPYSEQTLGQSFPGA